MAKNNKSKKRLALITLSLILTLTSCGKKDDPQKRYKENVRDIIEVYNDSSAFDYKNTLDKFYIDFINNYGSYMSEEEYQDFTYLMMASYQYKEEFSSEDTFLYLNMIMNVEDNKFGRGLYRAFIMRIVYENIFPAWRYNDDVYQEFNTLRSVVNNDKDFYSAIFSNDIDSLIKCIVDNTGASKTDVEKLILEMDAYSDIQESEEYNESELKETYKETIENLMNKIVQAKIKNDESFANTLFGKLLSKSKYYNDYSYGVINSLFDDTASIHGCKDFSAYYFDIPSEYLNTKKDIDEIKAYKVCKIIELGGNEENTYENDAMNLMIHLIDPSTLTDSSLTSKQIREILYENLKDEFESIEEFDDFFLTIANGSSMIYYDYFSIFERRLKKDGITYDDFVRFTSLVNFVNDNTTVNIDWNWDIEYPPYEEIKKMKEEEYNKLVSSSTYNWIFYGMDYKMCMEISNEIVKNNDLGYEYFYSPNCKYVYKNGKVYVSPSSGKVVSEVVSPRIGRVSGVDITYYEIPEDYKNGYAVECFYNIERELTLVPINGFVTTFYDETIGKTVNAFVVSLDKENEEELPVVRFAEYYSEYEKIQENKKLGLGAN